VSSIVNIDFVLDEDLSKNSSTIGVGDWLLMTNIIKNTEHLCVVTLIDGSKFTLIQIKPTRYSKHIRVAAHAEALFPALLIDGKMKAFSLGDIRHITLSHEPNFKNRMEWVYKKVNVDITVYMPDEMSKTTSVENEESVRDWVDWVYNKIDNSPAKVAWLQTPEDEMEKLWKK